MSRTRDRGSSGCAGVSPDGSAPDDEDVDWCRSLGIDGQQDQERYASLRGSRAHQQQKETVEV